MPKTRVLSISGSLRAGSSNASLLQAAAMLAPPDWEFVHFEGIGDLPHFNPDLDVEPPPPAVRALRTAMEQADAVILSTPEYAHGLPGVLKNALDWLVSGMEVYEKPFSLLGASQHSVHAPASLREILTTMSVRLPAQASVTVPLNGRKLDSAAIVAEPEFAAMLRGALAALDQAIALRRKAREQE